MSEMDNAFETGFLAGVLCTGLTILAAWGVATGVWF